MTYNLRKLVESDLQYTLEGDYGMPVILIDPDGNSFSLQGQVLYDTNEFDAETGAMIVYEKPVVTLRRSTLVSTVGRVPKGFPEERWAVRVPPTPDADEATETYLVERPIEGGRSIGFVRLYLMGTEQSS